MKSKFVYHVLLICKACRSSFYLRSLRLARVQVRNFKKVFSDLIINGGLKKGDTIQIFIERDVYVDDYTDYVFPDIIYYLRKVVK